jgi:hypothetical protein
MHTCPRVHALDRTVAPITPVGASKRQTGAPRAERACRVGRKTPVGETTAGTNRVGAPALRSGEGTITGRNGLSLPVSPPGWLAERSFSGDV